MAQYAGQPDQRQADQPGRIPGVDSLEQCDPQAFRLEAAGAVERALAGEVARSILERAGLAAGQ